MGSERGPLNVAVLDNKPHEVVVVNPTGTHYYFCYCGGSVHRV